MVNRRWVVALLISVCVCRGAMAEVAAEVTVEQGYRVDRLNWNIAGNTNGQNPNVLSELTWNNLVTRQTKLRLDLHNEAVYLFGGVGYGDIGSGANQDSDYFFNGRVGEFSRSNNEAGGRVADADIGIGYRFEGPSSRGYKGYLMPAAGYSVHRQELTMFNGNQTIDLFEPPELGPFPGLNSSYDTEWRGLWGGASLVNESLASGLKLVLEVKYHLVSYSAVADWNLRTDFAHPKSYEHNADGQGMTVAFNVTAPLNSHFSWLVGLDYGNWRTDYGVDTVYLAAGGIAQTRLNEVRWQSLALNLGLLLR